MEQLEHDNIMMLARSKYWHTYTNRSNLYEQNLLHDFTVHDHETLLFGEGTNMCRILSTSLTCKPKHKVITSNLIPNY